MFLGLGNPLTSLWPTLEHCTCGARVEATGTSDYLL